MLAGRGMKAGILPGCSNLDRSNRDTELQTVVVSLLIFTPLSFERSFSCSGVIIPLISSPYPVAVPGFEPRARRACYRYSTDAPWKHLNFQNRRTCSRLRDVIGLPNSSNDDPVLWFYLGQDAARVHTPKPLTQEPNHKTAVFDRKCKRIIVSTEQVATCSNP
ncbi:hypothetical protein CSKR_106222 [Clonorchis sinensis]|uniref:Uncharacterized protein n=1 Tax=Clonorchis sinensis TaxID=79923 RepID=A0A3R7FTC4_CLOSI|nr:hypothetical protein CSKR_106222 [Clonorchis sinensis]